MARGPTASIIITTHDRPELAYRALRTALGQTFPDLEVVIVDDGSEPPFELDGEPEGRVSLVRLPGSTGVSGARNAGLAAARGEWVTFLDDDDELLPGMLEVSLAAAARSSLPQPVAVISAMEILGPDALRKRVNMPVSLPKGKHYFLERPPAGTDFDVYNTLFIPRDVLLGLGGFDESLRAWVHADLFLRINAACSIQGVGEITYRVHRHGTRHVHYDFLAGARSFERTIAKHQDVFERHPAGHARCLRAIARAYLRSGKWGSAVRASTRALRLDPGRDGIRTWAYTLIGPTLYARYARLRRRSRNDDDTVP